MLRAFAATIRDTAGGIASLNPVERWNVDNMTLSGTGVLSMSGLYNGFNLGFEGPSLPQYNSINNEILTKITAILSLNNFSEIASEAGEIVAVVKYDPTIFFSGFGAIFSFGVNNSDRVAAFMTSNGFELLWNASTNRMSTPAFNGNVYYIISFVSTGSEYRIYIDDPINKRTLITVAGSNNGNWTNTVSTQKAAIGTLNGVLVGRPILFRDQMYFNRLLTDDERTIVFNELNEKYSIY